MSSDTVAVRWDELITREHLPKLVTMGLALWLHATNSMLVATTVPSAVEEIGGLHLISWAFALYLAGSISAAASISMIVARLGLRRSLMRAATSRIKSRRTPKFCGDDDERLVQQLLGLQINNERRHRAVEFLDQLVLIQNPFVMHVPTDSIQEIEVV